jgi:general secretion pathway protein G
MARLTANGEAVSKPSFARGFTLIELIVVLAIIALLASLVAPRYFHSVERAREASLKTSLNVMRDAIDKYLADKGSYPDSLDDLVQKGYMRQVPEDPVTGSRDSWQMLPPPSDSQLNGALADVRSGARGHAESGEPYSSW